MGRLIDADELIEKMGRVKFQTNLSEELHRNRPFLDYADVLGCIYNQQQPMTWKRLRQSWKNYRMM